MTLGIVAAVVALAAGVGYFALSSKPPAKTPEVRKRSVNRPEVLKPLDETHLLQPRESVEFIVDKRESTFREIEVLPLDGPAFLAFGTIDPARRGADLRADTLAIAQQGVNIEQGKKQIRSVDSARDSYYCAVINPSSEKPIQVTVRFR